MKVLTLLGTRPEIIRLSRVIPRLDDALGRENHFLANTDQNSDDSLNRNFFTELGLRDPDYCMGVATGCGTGKSTVTFAEQLAAIFPRIENAINSFRPDRLLVLGDTNSSLGAIVAARMGVPVYHMEAGNRSYSPSSPEEVNRRLVDHASAVLLPYTERSRQNLLAEGIHSSRIFVTGNPIGEVIEHYRAEWEQGGVATRATLTRLGLEAGRFFLVTLHRAENVDRPDRLSNFLKALAMLNHQYSLPVIVSTHPHLRARLEENGRLAGSVLRFLPPFSFFDFLRLQTSALATLSDSGTVQEECCLLQRPLICLRDSTERPECLEAGASVLTGSSPDSILRAVRLVTGSKPEWTPPPEYLRGNVSETVTRILLGHREEAAK
jgi:UDP-N-acetylglucosamine 2-epimerase (non-hydrolysing)